MKKYLAACLSLVCAGFAFAGGIENKTNMSTGYLRNPSRNTEHKRPEAAFYNIAGTAFMDDGLYIEMQAAVNLNIQKAPAQQPWLLPLF